MQSEFTYTLVSDVGNGGDISNTCNEILDFQTNKYEVCMQDMVLSTGAWDNVRASCNMFYIDSKFLPQITAHIKPGRYGTLDRFINAINLAINEHHYQHVVQTQTDEEHTRLQEYQGFGGRFKLVDFVPEKPGDPGRQAPDGLCIYDNAGNCKPVMAVEPSPPTPAVPAHLKFESEAVFKTETKITFSKEVAYLLGIIPTITTPVPPIANGWKIEQSKIDLNRNNLTLLWVFADFISPTIVGNYLLPIIRMVPIQTHSGSVEHSMFALQYYVPVKQAKFADFRITIRDRLDGQPMKIRGIVTISLHFRTINVG